MNPKFKSTVSWKVLIDPRATDDIKNAMDYYDKHKTGLGIKFLNEVDQCIQFLKENPYLAVRYDEVRCIPTKKFPFMLHYIINSTKQEIFIVGVFHTSLNPKQWKERR